DRGRLKRTLTPALTINRTVYDFLGRVSSEWVGTNDTPATGFWSPNNNTPPSNMVKVREYEYDGGLVGDGNNTKVTEIPGGTAANRVTQTWFDWRDRAVASKSGLEATEATTVNRPLVYTDLDNLGEATQTRLYDGDGVSLVDTTPADGVPDAPAATNLAAQS